MPTEDSAAHAEGAGGSELLLSPSTDGGNLEGAGLLWLVPGAELVAAWAERCRALAEDGAVVVVLVPAAVSDRAALRALEARAAALVDEAPLEEDRLAVGGVGRGGTLAFLAGCTSTRFGAVVDLGGDVLYPELDADRPTQPLELLLNLDRPLLAVLPDDPAPDGSLALLRSALADAHKEAEVHAVSSTTDAAGQEEAWRHAVRFLRERL